MRASSAPHLVSARSGGGHGFHYPDNKVRASSAPHLVTARSWGSHGFQYPDNKVRASSVPHLVLARSGGGHGFQYPDNKVRASRVAGVLTVSSIQTTKCVCHTPLYTASIPPHCPIPPQGEPTM